MTSSNVNETVTTDYVTPDGQQYRQTIVNEVPVAISIEGISYSVMMITPVDTEAFVIGFLFTEGIIDTFNEIKDIVLSETQIPNTQNIGLLADVTLTSRKLSQFKHHRRTRLGKTGCGLCGIESLDLAFPKIDHKIDDKNTKIKGMEPHSIAELDTMILNTARETLTRHQEIGRTVGGIHCAVILNNKGQVESSAEDIGRHNALDKAIGKQLKQNNTMAFQHCIMTSRCSTELVQKAARANLASLIHLASPSSLAVQMAKNAGIRIVHIPRVDSPRVYA
ncbi:formate dehydrogenase accessory sulfurtransferase FdhD [Marinomonas mediterranea]|uniref:formate dehydrogenase accessory sulfurtransferase FdhD n=1 Tax=Marinomonas mediterranea TaxID=119864 RepID=UPI00234B1169|nr:formate dehydrogenase accessory sulfurtransferase FdhD [Marinomonas mediterranea]WCN09783.1 sulfurtransferase FdhD [Marinomonas mediterranea]